jgi:hypothetical protein
MTEREELWKKMMQSRPDNSDRGSHPHMRRLIKEF